MAGKGNDNIGIASPEILLVARLAAMEPNRDLITETQSQRPGEPGGANVGTNAGLSTTSKVVLALIFVLAALSILLVVLLRDPLPAVIYVVAIAAARACVSILARRIVSALVWALVGLSLLYMFLFHDPLPGAICFAVSLAACVVNAAILIYGSIRERRIVMALLGILMTLLILVLLAIVLSDVFSVVVK
jgi:hypothetical protein